ncbi:hypothetical protein [Asaia bogorensis]|uniref:Uncharacterized protein n=1 Tax=Asaia bogorensis NBRC 16594 TaxID=1231624 RepID=A0AAN4R2H5_9PROT|nr:hypothetical protein [Asaia bogorensis]GBQ78088.1 hypothetical protein AA0311_1649 [Asaia bogorensis NBRC 16594]GEL53826.1 hypothetical protein ABO01nite_18330 [Asaia bogorensis NBRC 16594]
MQMLANVMINCERVYTLRYLVNIMRDAKFYLFNKDKEIFGFKKEFKVRFSSEEEILHDFEKWNLDTVVFWNSSNEALFAWWDLAGEVMKITLSFDGWSEEKSTIIIQDIISSLLRRNFHRGDGVFFSIEAG